MQVKETAESQSWLAKYQAVEEELLRVKENHQKKEKCLREQIESIQQQLKNKVSTGFTLVKKIHINRTQRGAVQACCWAEDSARYKLR